MATKRMSSSEEERVQRMFLGKGYKMEWNNTVNLYRITRTNAIRATERDFYNVEGVWRKWNEVQWN